jgi:hypothetical protein
VTYQVAGKRESYLPRIKWRQDAAEKVLTAQPVAYDVALGLRPVRMKVWLPSLSRMNRFRQMGALPAMAFWALVICSSIPRRVRRARSCRYRLDDLVRSGHRVARQAMAG